jgi:carboxylesterase type B
VRGSLINGINTYKGIPYAAPPFGSNRLRPPQPVAPWSGVRDAFDYGPKPPQLPYPPPWDALLPELAGPGADCLNLNIWSPDLGSAGLPVMVWIPGGEFQHGTAAMATYDGSHFARDGIVCVSINYRVGADGFLYLGEGESKGGDANANRALLDQVAALGWVQENIAAFGGDPGNITVFGQSAGAISIGMLLGMPRAEGLFRRAIVQSGGAHPLISAASARLVGLRLAEKLGVEATHEAIAAVPIARTLQAQAELMADLMAHPDPERWSVEVAVSIMPWQPVIDGEVIPAQPLDRIMAGAGAGIDLMIGSNLDESHFFMIPGSMIDRITPQMLAGAVAAYGLPVEAALATYRAARPGAGPGELLSAIQGDWYFRIPALRLADAHATSTMGMMSPARTGTSNAATYVYEFAWRSPQFNGRLGACHGLEIPFVFDVLDTPGEGDDPLLGADPPQQHAVTIHAAWIAFATRGECPWPKYERIRRVTLRFDTLSEVVEDPRSAVRALWAGVH